MVPGLFPFMEGTTMETLLAITTIIGGIGMWYFAHLYRAEKERNNPTPLDTPPIPDTDTQLEELAHSDPVWKFAEDNRDLMPQWELNTVGVASMPKFRRYSEWATYCGNLPIMDREVLIEEVFPSGRVTQ